LQLVTGGHPIAKEGTYAVETYKVALRAYVGLQKLTEAEETMQALESLVTSGGDARAAESLTAIYIALGRELEGQLERLRKANDATGLAAVSRGFELFLERIATRPGNTFNSLNWVAETFYRMGSGYDSGGQPVPQEARGYYEKAYSADQNLLAQAGREAGFASPEALVAVRLRMARCLRRLGRYSEAIDLLAGLLKEKPNLLDAQREACLTFEDRGTENPLYFLAAIQGSRKQKGPDGRETNLIWGWAGLSARLRGDPKFRQDYFDARYRLAWCRYQYGIKQRNADKRAEALKRAQTELVAIYRLNPSLSGPEMVRKYDDLLRSIQKASGAPVTGLPRLKTTGTTQ
jgi:tetratricopeptide (TPR) repeat protein